MITSRQNTKVMLARTLLAKPHQRRESQAFVVEGVRLVEEAVNAGWKARLALYSAGLSARGQALLPRLAGAGVDIEQVTPEVMRSISNTEAPQGLLAVINQQVLPMPARVDFILVVDEVRDPGNLGTLLRSAAAAGVQAVFVSPRTVDPFSPKVVRGAMGAHFRLPIVEMSWPMLAAEFSREGSYGNLRLYLAEAGRGQDYWDADLRRPLALVIGGEAEGAGPEARSLADASLCIPMQGGSESLNAGVAGSLLMFEVVRQRSSFSH